MYNVRQRATWEVKISYISIESHTCVSLWLIHRRIRTSFQYALSDDATERYPWRARETTGRPREIFLASIALHRDKAICQSASWERIRIAFRCVALAHRHSRITRIPRVHGDGICSGIPVGNSRRLRDYSRHPLREYIIARRVYVSSYDRHFRFRRALLTSFRFWARKCVYTHIDARAHSYTHIHIHTHDPVVRHCPAHRAWRRCRRHRRISRNILRNRSLSRPKVWARSAQFAIYDEKLCYDSATNFRRAKFNWKTK